MAPSKIRKAIGVVKDHTSIGLAIVFGDNSRSDLEVAIIKATPHKESPRHERHVREIICLTSFSRPMVTACVSAIARRLNKTRNWVVALKTLMLVHRLINDGDHTYQDQIFFSKRRGMSFLSMSGFRDSTASRDYTTFIRMYALYLDQQLEFRQNQGEDDQRTTPPPVHDMTNEDILARAHHLLQLFGKFLACRPTGPAKCNKLVTAALYTALKESFQIYFNMTEVIATLIDRFMQLQVADMIKVHGIFSSVSKQYDELRALYDWCKSISITSNFPNVEKIPKEKLDTMNDFISQKSEMLQNRTLKPDEDQHAMKTLLNDVCVESTENNDVKILEAMEPEKEKKIQEIGGLLDLSEDPATTEEHRHQMLALALFDGLTTVPESSSSTTTTNPWESFKDSTEDWETKLVESASYLSNPRAPLDTLMLDGMYQFRSMTEVVAYSGYGGSASSIAFGTNGKTAVLALPTANDGAKSLPKTDPFAASLSIAPPAYVQISDMEEKQRLLFEQQVYWQQYAREGIQLQYPYQYVSGSYPQAGVVKGMS